MTSHPLEHLIRAAFERIAEYGTALLDYPPR